MAVKDYYKIMEVKLNASQEEIKQAYHRLARQYHPDVSKEPNAEYMFKEINEAYDVLKEPQRRAAYNSTLNRGLPSFTSWFVTKKDARKHDKVQKPVKKNTGARANDLGKNGKKNAKQTYTRTPFQEKDNSTKSAENFPIFTMIFFVLVLSAITMAIIYAVEQFNQWQNYQQMQAAILQGNETAIKTLERSNTETARKILEGEGVKKALITNYIQRVDRPVWSQLEIYDDPIKADILKDKQVSRRLIAYYYRQIDREVKADNFNKAFSLLDTLKKKYSYFEESSNKYKKVQKKKQQRLAHLTQKYMECLDQTLAPLLERTHCMAEARQKIEHVGLEHNLPNDSNLPAMYAEEIRHALTEKNYDHAERLLVDWQKILPAVSEQRDALQEILGIHRQVKNIIADMTGYDNNKIIKRLSQLTADPALRKDVLEMPKIQNNLLRYHLNEALMLIAVEKAQVNLPSRTMSKLKEILAIAEDKKTPEMPTPAFNQPSLQSIPWYSGGSNPSPAASTSPKLQESPSSKLQGSSSLKLQGSPSIKSEVAVLLQECQRHYKANHLTAGSHGNAVDCYRIVLKKEPSNSDALNGLKAIENRYKLWAENALRKKQLDKAKNYIKGLEKTNPNSRFLVPLRRQLKTLEIVKIENKSLQSKKLKKINNYNNVTAKVPKEAVAEARAAAMLAEARAARLRLAKARAAAKLAARAAKLAEARAARLRLAKARAAKLTEDARAAKLTEAKAAKLAEEARVAEAEEAKAVKLAEEARVAMAEAKAAKLAEEARVAVAEAKAAKLAEAKAEKKNLKPQIPLLAKTAIALTFSNNYQWGLNL